MDQFLWDKYEQLKLIAERLEDAVAAAEQHGPANVYGLRFLMYDVRRMRDDAKAEYDSF